MEVTFNLPNSDLKSKHKWRVPALLAAVLDLILSVALVVYFVRVSIYTLQRQPDQTPFFNLSGIGQLFRTLMFMCYMPHHSIFIPVHLVMFGFGIRVVSTIFEAPKGGVDESFTAADEADNGLQSLLGWRRWSLFQIGFFCLGFSLEHWGVVLCRIFLKLILMAIARKHLDELQKIVTAQENIEKQEAKEIVADVVAKYEEYTRKILQRKQI